MRLIKIHQILNSKTKFSQKQGAGDWGTAGEYNRYSKTEEKTGRFRHKEHHDTQMRKTFGQTNVEMFGQNSQAWWERDHLAVKELTMNSVYHERKF